MDLKDENKKLNKREQVSQYLSDHGYTITPVRIIAFLALCYIILFPQEIIGIVNRILEGSI